MPRDGAIIFRDLVGKLEVLHLVCDKCGRHGRYRLDRLIEQYGIDAKLFDWGARGRLPAEGGAERLRRMRGTVPGPVEGGVTPGGGPPQSPGAPIEA
jgi:hypothetical protein